MTITNESADSLITGMLEVAKNIRAEYKYSEDEKMTPTVIILAKEEHVIIPLHYRNETEKRSMMRVVGVRAKAADAEAVAVASDVRFANSDDLAKYFKMADPREVGTEKFIEEYHRILSRYGGEIKNLPREVWNEAVCCFIKGPTIGIHCKMTYYVEGPDDTVQYTKESSSGDTEDNKAKCGMIPDWWL